MEVETLADHKRQANMNPVFSAIQKLQALWGDSCWKTVYILFFLVDIVCFFFGDNPTIEVGAYSLSIAVWVGKGFILQKIIERLVMVMMDMKLTQPHGFFNLFYLTLNIASTAAFVALYRANNFTIVSLVFASLMFVVASIKSYKHESLRHFCMV